MATEIDDVMALVKPQVHAMHAYTLAPLRPPIKLNQNENPHGFPPELMQETLERFARLDWARYPEFDPRPLREAIARRVGCTPEQVLVGNGSNELIYSTFAVTLGPGDEIVIPVPTFTVYRLIATLMGATIHQPRLSADTFELPTSVILTMARQRAPKIIVICTPNNPTATSYPIDELRRLCAESGALVVIDEAYQEFASQDLIPLLDEFPNVVILRTFSKAMAMGGLRVGYAIARPELAEQIHKGQLPYALNALSATAALVALENPEPFETRVRDILAERERLHARLDAIEWLEPVPSDANFILTRLRGVRPQELFDHLLADGILIRDVSHYPGLVDYVRISVGTPDESDALIRSLEQFDVR